MFAVLSLFCSWLPSPLDGIVFGALCLVLLVVIIKLVAKVIDMLPFT